MHVTALRTVGGAIAITLLSVVARGVPQDYGSIVPIVLPAPFAAATWEGPFDRANWRATPGAFGVVGERLSSAGAVSAFGLRAERAEAVVREGRLCEIRLRYPRRETDDFQVLRAQLEVQSGGRMTAGEAGVGERVLRFVHAGVRVELRAVHGDGVTLVLSRVEG